MYRALISFAVCSRMTIIQTQSQSLYEKMMFTSNQNDEILSGNRIYVVNNIENPNDNGKSGQIIQLVGDKAHIEFDEGGTALINVVCLENLPRRFCGTLMKYSTTGFIRNWKIRLFEVWSSSITYRIENESKYKGVIMIKPHSEILYNFTEINNKTTPLQFSLGLQSEGKTLWMCSDSEQQILDLKLALQDAINDSVMFLSTV